MHERIAPQSEAFIAAGLKGLQSIAPMESSEGDPKWIVVRFDEKLESVPLSKILEPSEKLPDIGEDENGFWDHDAVFVYELSDYPEHHSDDEEGIPF